MDVALHTATAGRWSIQGGSSWPLFLCLCTRALVLPGSGDLLDIE